jgi:hypothetical protein
VTQGPGHYEFNAQQNAVFVKLASALAFVGLAMLVPAVLLGIAAIVLLPTLLGEGVCGVFAVLLVVIGLLDYGAARHFRHVVTEPTRDIPDLMIAVEELANVYEIQRWLWIVLAAVVLVALTSTVIGYSL